MTTDIAPLSGTGPGATEPAGPAPGTPAADAAPSRPAGFSRLPSLTGLRFIAAVMVFLFHASLTTEPPLNPFSGGVSDFFHAAASKTGWMGVTFFFLLSGFVLTYSARPNDTPRRFWRRRFVKLYPSHLVGWVAAMVLFAAATATWQQWLPNLLLLQTWVPDYHTYLSINPPSWSLSCEIFFYLCFPLLNRWLSTVRPERLWALAGGLVVAITAIPALGYLLLPDGTMSNGFPVSEVQYWAVYMLPPVRVLDFLLGMVMARILMSGRWIGLGLLPACALVAVGYAVANTTPWLFGLNAAALIPFALLIPAVAATDLNGGRSPFRGRVMVWLGEVSFAFYIVHNVVLVHVRSLIGETRQFGLVGGVGVMALYFAVCMAFAWLLHKGVEMPMMRRFAVSRAERRARAGLK
ncbi:acyltransferase [Streptomyces albidoflavus]|uniref:acyltransferase family protein n=1 Tax=Streptomyces TaxID=1883 RepID=UPI0002493F10|nr:MULTISPECIES: acyltransferase [Streptomyces]RZD78004.1 acyltransferase [Streptomyces albidoflavus]